MWHRVYVFIFSLHNGKPVYYFDFIKMLFINHFDLDAQGSSLGFL